MKFKFNVTDCECKVSKYNVLMAVGAAVVYGVKAVIAYNKYKKENK